ncbi:hypothetical protein QQ045_008063 [Rhodiola kirilowii]
MHMQLREGVDKLEDIACPMLLNLLSKIVPSSMWSTSEMNHYVYESKYQSYSCLLQSTFPSNLTSYIKLFAAKQTTIPATSVISVLQNPERIIATRQIRASPMAACFSIKHMFVLSFLLLCFLSALAEGRRLRVEMESNGKDQVEPRVYQVEQKQVKEHELSGAEGEGGDEVLVGMDYTPASRKSPVHN